MTDTNMNKQEHNINTTNSNTLNNQNNPVTKTECGNSNMVQESTICTNNDGNEFCITTSITVQVVPKLVNTAGGEEEHEKTSKSLADDSTTKSLKKGGSVKQPGDRSNLESSQPLDATDKKPCCECIKSFTPSPCDALLSVQKSVLSFLDKIF